jgi:hypothetical protein
MIVRDAPGGIDLITQPDHARLARAIMEHCVSLNDRPRRATILHAIGEHDAGWTDADAAPTVDAASGEVADFVHAPLQVRQGAWPIAVSRLSDDPYAAALVAQHALSVYDRYRNDVEWQRFFAGMEAARDARLAVAGVARQELETGYVFVRLGDLISLVFCTGWSDAHRYRDWTVARAGERVVVTPDPFGGRKIPIAIGARRLSSRHFPSDAALREALAEAPTTVLEGEVSG